MIIRYIIIKSLLILFNTIFSFVVYNFIKDEYDKRIIYDCMFIDSICKNDNNK